MRLRLRGGRLRPRARPPLAASPTSTPTALIIIPALILARAQPLLPPPMRRLLTATAVALAAPLPATTPRGPPAAAAPQISRTSQPRLLPARRVLQLLLARLLRAALVQRPQQRQVAVAEAGAVQRGEDLQACLGGAWRRARAHAGLARAWALLHARAMRAHAQAWATCALGNRTPAARACVMFSRRACFCCTCRSLRCSALLSLGGAASSSLPPCFVALPASFFLGSSSSCWPGCPLQARRQPGARGVAGQRQRAQEQSSSSSAEGQAARRRRSAAAGARSRRAAVPAAPPACTCNLHTHSLHHTHLLSRACCLSSSESMSSPAAGLPPGAAPLLCCLSLRWRLLRMVLGAWAGGRQGQ